MSLIDLKVKEFLNEVDSNSPAPGGGSVSAVSASLGVALSRMVSHLTFNKKKFLSLDEKIRTKYEDDFITLNNIKEELIPLIDKDTEAFNQIMEAYKLPKESDEEKALRKQTIETATLEAIKVPYEIARLSYKSLEVVEKMMPYGNQFAISDIGVGCLLLHAGLEGAILNVRINIGGISDIDQVKMYETSCENLLNKGKEVKDRILKYVNDSL